MAKTLKSNTSHKFSNKVDKQSLQALTMAGLTWQAYNKQSKHMLNLSGFYTDFLNHIRLQLLNYYEIANVGDPTRTDTYKAIHYKRLEKAVIDEIKALGAKEQAFGKKLIGDMINDVYESSSFGFKPPKNLWQSIASDRWIVSTFSDRVWKQKDVLRQALMGDIRYGVASGMPIGDLSQRLQKTTGQSEYNAYRLVRNESMIASHHAKARAYKDLGVKRVRIVVALDERTCETCSQWAGETMSLDEALERLPFHVQCRCTYVALDADGELISGGQAGALNRYSERAIRHAERQYEAIRKWKKDVEKIANNTGIHRDIIQEVKNHVFYNKHELDGGFRRFDPDFDMAQAWTRLEQGKYRDSDILLINHELAELVEMKYNGLTYEKAHEKANLRFNWQKLIFDDD